LPAFGPRRPARFEYCRFSRCSGGFLLSLPFDFGAPPGTYPQPAQANRDSDHEHQHENLICRHTPSLFISFDVSD